jgi:hypothetical protein
MKGAVNMPYGYNGFLNPYTMIIVILIVLQWFRVGCKDGVGGFGPEPGLLNNGGLFIIAIFLLVFCSCGKQVAPIAPVAAARHCGC